MELREVTYLAVAVRIVAAVIIGGLLGLERARVEIPTPWGIIELAMAEGEEPVVRIPEGIELVK